MGTHMVFIGTRCMMGIIHKQPNCIFKDVHLGKYVRLCNCYANQGIEYVSALKAAQSLCRAWISLLRDSCREPCIGEQCLQLCLSVCHTDGDRM